jgi:hypothetical protein
MLGCWGMRFLGGRGWGRCRTFWRAGDGVIVVMNGCCKCGWDIRPANMVAMIDESKGFGRQNIVGCI